MGRRGKSGMKWAPLPQRPILIVSCVGTWQHPHHIIGDEFDINMSILAMKNI